MPYTVNNKKLSGFKDVVNQDPILSFDKNNNPLNKDDFILILKPCIGYTDIQVKKLDYFMEDTTQKLFLGYKLKNGQYRALDGLYILLVDNSFVSSHKQLLKD